MTKSPARGGNTYEPKTLTNEYELLKLYDNQYMQTYYNTLKSANYVRYRIFKEIFATFHFAGKTVLDFGCGAGLYVDSFTTLGATVVGTDVSRVAITKAHLRAKNAQSNTNFIVADGSHLPFKECVFDFVFLSEVLEHLLNPLSAIKETSNVLKKHGILLGSVPCGNKFSVEWIMTWLLGGPKKTKDGLNNFWPDWGTIHLQRFTNTQLKALYRENKVTVHMYRYYDHFFHHLCTFLNLLKRIGVNLRNIEHVEFTDYMVFKKFSNGTGMIFCGYKT